MQVSLAKLTVVFILGMTCFLGLIQSLRVTVAWWNHAAGGRTVGMVVDRAAAGLGIRVYPLLFDLPAGMPRLPAAG